MFSPVALLPQHGVTWHAERDDLIVASCDVPPERPEVRMRIDERGALQTTSALRWGKAGQKAYGYIPCGCEVRAERRFGDLVVPSSISVGWWFGMPRYKPFFEAELHTLTRVP